MKIVPTNKCIISALASILLISCGLGNRRENEAMTPEKMEKKLASGVALIKNTFYYSMEFDNNISVYFTGIDKNGDLEGVTFDEDEVEPVTAFGTGFFVSKDGILATNSHVACPAFSTKDARKAFVSAFQTLAEECQEHINELNVQLGELRLIIDSGNSEYNSKYTSLQEERDNYQSIVNGVNRLSSAEYEASRHCNIGIALNNTHVNSTSDFKECVTIANDQEHDLALIQLKDKETPKKCHVFEIKKKSRSENSRKSSSDDSKTKVGTSLYMIGFNWGPSLGLTKEGVKAQVTKGDVTQDTDEDKIMYSIPALQGSSGSPVINKSGKVVAVNFAGINTTQSFNFGIKVKHLIELLDENDY